MQLKNKRKVIFGLYDVARRTRGLRYPNVRSRAADIQCQFMAAKLILCFTLFPCSWSGSRRRPPSPRFRSFRAIPLTRPWPRSVRAAADIIALTTPSLFFFLFLFLELRCCTAACASPRFSSSGLAMASTSGAPSRSRSPCASPTRSAWYVAAPHGRWDAHTWRFDL